MMMMMMIPGRWGLTHLCLYMFPSVAAEREIGKLVFGI